MKTAIIGSIFLIAAMPSAPGGTLTLSGDLSQVSVSISYPKRTVVVLIPHGVDGAVVTADALENLDIGSPAGGGRQFTAVFAGEISVNTPASGIVVSDAKPASGAGDHSKDSTKTTVAGEKVEAKEPAEPTLAFGGLALRLPGQSSLKDRSPSYDASIPESPAATLLGSSAKLVRFSETKDAVTQLLNVTDADGKMSTGFSFALHPYRLLARPTLEQYTYGAAVPDDKLDYSGGKWIRFLSRLDLSLAATVDDSTDAAGVRGTSAAVGVSGFIFNRGDSRLALADKFAKLGNSDAFDPTVTPGAAPQVTDVSSAEFAKMANEAYDSLWNDSYWAFGFARRLRSATGDLGDFKSQGGAAWSTFGYGFEGAGRKLGLKFLEDNSQVLFHASYRDGQRVAATATTPAFEEDVWIYGAQLRIGRDGFNAFGEILWESHRPGSGPRRSTETYYIGFEKRLKESLWLQVAIGSEEKPETTQRDALLRTALNFGFGDQVLNSSSDK